MSSSTILYNFWRSSPSYRVRIALNLKKIAYEYKVVNTLQNQHLEPEYLAINPNARVPTLQIDGEVLTESTAIIEYLDATRPQRPLLRQDPLLNYKIRSISQIINAGIQPVQNLVLLKQLEQEYGVDPIKVGGRAVMRGLKVIEEVAQKRKTEYLLDDEITMADILLVPQLFVAQVFGITAEKQFPHLGKLEQKLKRIPEFEAAHPLNMPDTPEKEAGEYKKLKQ